MGEVLDAEPDVVAVELGLPDEAVVVELGLPVEAAEAVEAAAEEAALDDAAEELAVLAAEEEAEEEARTLDRMSNCGVKLVWLVSSSLVIWMVYELPSTVLLGTFHVYEPLFGMCAGPRVSRRPERHGPIAHVLTGNHRALVEVAVAAVAQGQGDGGALLVAPGEGGGLAGMQQIARRRHVERVGVLAEREAGKGQQHCRELDAHDGCGWRRDATASEQRVVWECSWWQTRSTACSRIGKGINECIWVGTKGPPGGLNYIWI